MLPLPHFRKALFIFRAKSGGTTKYQHDDVSRKVVFQLRARQRPIPSRRIIARNDLEFVLGTLSVAVIASFATAVYAYHWYTRNTSARHSNLTVRSLVENGPRVFVSQIFLHEGLFHLGFNLVALIPVGLAAASAPTMLFRWAAIPAVFVVAGTLSGAAQISPKVSEALGPANTTLLRDLHLSSAEVVRTGNLNQYLVALRGIYSATLSKLDDNAVDDLRTAVCGASGGTLGLVTFASLEWALGGARVWPALLVPLVVLYTDAGRLLHPTLALSQRAGNPESHSRRRHPAAAYHPAEDERIGDMGDASALAAGAACWVAGRGLRVTVAASRFIFSALRSKVRGGTTQQ